MIVLLDLLSGQEKCSCPCSILVRRMRENGEVYECGGNSLNRSKQLIVLLEII